MAILFLVYFACKFFFLSFNFFFLVMSLYAYSLFSTQTRPCYKLFSMWNKFVSIILVFTFFQLVGKKQKKKKVG